MTELEGQLAAALKRLSAQFRTEQQQRAEERRRDAEQLEALRQRVEQQAEQIGALRQRIERQDAESEIWRRQSEQLDRQVKGLAQDYSTLAEILRELWR